MVLVQEQVKIIRKIKLIWFKEIVDEGKKSIKIFVIILQLK